MRYSNKHSAVSIIKYSQSFGKNKHIFNKLEKNLSFFQQLKTSYQKINTKMCIFLVFNYIFVYRGTKVEFL